MKRTLKRATFLFCAVCIGALVGCGADDAVDDGYPPNAQDPSGNTPMATMTVELVEKALKAAQVEIDKSRPAGIKKLIAALVTDLKAQGIDTSSIATIDDKYFADFYDTTKQHKLDKAYVSTSSSSSLKQALTNNKDYDCPILAKETNAGTTCEKLAQAMATKVSAEIAKDKATVEATIKQTYADLDAQAQAFVAAWAHTATAYGANVALVFAMHELKAAAKCDSKANAMQISYNYGVEQGWDIVIGMKAWAISQVTSTCTVNTDAVAETVRRRAKAKINAYMTQNMVCEDEDISNLNAVLQQAEAKRKSGITKGIDQRVDVLKQELFRARQNAAACNNGGGGGEPVIIDLDGDGLQLTTSMVRFDLLGDGNKELTTWAGPREGFLAIDHNGNGRIDGVAELMGNKSQCGAVTCYDGLEALKALDGNNDKVINANDAAFSSFVVWVDANQDGESQAAELNTLAHHGISAIRLNATSTNVKLAGGTLTERMQVVTNRGLRFAHDAWFQMKLSAANLPALMP